MQKAWPPGGLILLAVLLFATACSGSSSPAVSTAGNNPTVLTSSSGTAMSSTAAESTASNSGPAVTGSSESASQPVSSSAGRETSTGRSASACTANDLSVAATRLPGAVGSNYALLTFTNSSSATCALTGYPGASLLDSGRRPLGTPAQRTPGDSTTVVLAKGSSASTLLADSSATCQADVRSTYVQVFPPNSTVATVLPLVLPPCTLSMKPVVAGTAPTP